jgi:hypothetical protein
VSKATPGCVPTTNLTRVSYDDDADPQQRTPAVAALAHWHPAIIPLTPHHGAPSRPTPRGAPWGAPAPAPSRPEVHGLRRHGAPRTLGWPARPSFRPPLSPPAASRRRSSAGAGSGSGCCSCTTGMRFNTFAARFSLEMCPSVFSIGTIFRVIFLVCHKFPINRVRETY